MANLADELRIAAEKVTDFQSHGFYTQLTGNLRECARKGGRVYNVALPEFVDVEAFSRAAAADGLAVQANGRNILLKW